MNNSNELIVIEDETQKKYLKNLVIDIANTDVGLLEKFIAKQHFLAIPLPNFTIYDYLPGIAKACQYFGYQKAYVIPLEIDENVYQISLTNDGLEKYYRKCGIFHSLILSETLDFVFLSGKEDYCLIAGKKDFVEYVLNKSIDKAREEYELYANDPFWDYREQKFLKEISNRYKIFNW